MGARAEAAAARGERILDAAEAAFDELPFDEITLAVIAERAGVSAQTIIRRFGGKEGLFLATSGTPARR
jgi:AcrR family transcriptional regulator